MINAEVTAENKPACAPREYVSIEIQFEEMDPRTTIKLFWRPTNARDDAGGMVE